MNVGDKFKYRKTRWIILEIGKAMVIIRELSGNATRSIPIERMEPILKLHSKEEDPDEQFF